MPYSGDPSSSLADAVRFWLDDTGATPLLSDAEIAYVIATDVTANTDPIRIAAACCTKLISKYAGRASITADGVSYSGDQLQDKYTRLATALRQEAERRDSFGAKPVFAADCPPPRNFREGMYDNPEAGWQQPVAREWIDWDDWDDPANYQPSP